MADDPKETLSPYEQFVQGVKGVRSSDGAVPQRGLDILPADPTPSTEQLPRVGDQKSPYVFLPTDLELWVARQRHGRLPSSAFLRVSVSELDRTPYYQSPEPQAIAPTPEKVEFRKTGFDDAIRHFLGAIPNKDKPGSTGAAFREAARDFNAPASPTIAGPNEAEKKDDLGKPKADGDEFKS